MKKLGRYDLIRVLGKGAMGLVYEARDPNLDRRVAIKTIKVESLSAQEAADYEVRFRTEARSAARLQHPHIVSVFDSDRDIDIAYLVMEFIDGQDLKHHLDQGRLYTLGQTVAIMGDLLSALDYAHLQGVVHRDVKPANLLVEPSGRIKLTDFGVARIQGSADLTRTHGTMVGTLKYMSPEQVQGHAIDARTDLFAAGVMLYQLLTNQRPFVGATDYDVIQSIMGDLPTAPSAINPGLPKSLDAVIARALAKSRDARFGTAHEFHEALIAAVPADADQTITPRVSANAGTAGWRLGLALPPFGQRPGAFENSSGATSLAVSQEAELVYWKDIKDAQDMDVFEGFLRRFPTGIYADLAKRKLKFLRDSGSDAAHDDGYDGTLVLGQGDESGPAADADRGPVPRSRATPSDNADSPTELIASSHEKSWRLKWVLGGVVVMAMLALAGVYGGVWYSAGSGTVAPPSGVSLAVPAPSVAVPTATRDAPRAANATTEAAAASSPAAQTPVAKPKAVAAATPDPRSAPRPKAASTSDKPTEPKSSSESLASAKQSPAKTCAGRWFLSYQICMSKECARPENAKLPICLERRAQERRNQDRSQLDH